MAEEVEVHVDLADIAVADEDNNTVDVKVVDIHSPRSNGSNISFYYRMRRTQRFRSLFQAHAAYNGYRNIDRFVFLRDGVRVTSECTIRTLGYNSTLDCLKVMPIVDWIRRSIQLVNRRPNLSNDLAV